MCWFIFSVSSIQNDYQSLAKNAIWKLLPFPTTYLYESGFSSYASTKTKHHNKLEAKADIGIQLSSIKLKIEVLVNEKKQYHSYH